MPSKKKKYNARFPAGRIKKIMQSDEEIGKVAQAVPVIIFFLSYLPRTLELFVESLLNKTLKITNSRNAKTLSTSHMKQCIMAENRFDFLRELVKNIPDISVAEEAANYNEDEAQSSPEQQNYPDSDTPYDLSMPSTSSRATRASTNGDFQPPQMPLRYAENGSQAATTGKRALSHDEHMRNFVDERRAHLKRQAPGAMRAILNVTDDIAEQPKSKKINAFNEHLQATYTAEVTSAAKHEDQMRAHLIRQAALAQCASGSDYISQVFRPNEDERSVREVDLSNPGSTATRGQLPQDRFLAGKKYMGRGTTTAQNMSVPSSSVIRHTTSLSTAAPELQQPPRLYRTDSAPTTVAGNWQQQQLMHETKSLNVLHQQRRLKHQSQSVPGGYNSVSTPPHKTSVQPQLPPIPAPIVSIDFCNKPVVKIDYSNISMPAKASVAPLSAPATMPGSIANNNATGFNFNAEPVFNIDLSNIVATSTNTLNDHPAVATISIGNIAPMPSFLNPLVAAPTNLPNNSNPPINPAVCRNSSGSLIYDESSSANARATTSSTTMATNKNNPFFELDEDYDNI